MRYTYYMRYGNENPFPCKAVAEIDINLPVDGFVVPTETHVLINEFLPGQSPSLLTRGLGSLALHFNIEHAGSMNEIKNAEEIARMTMEHIDITGTHHLGEIRARCFLYSDDFTTVTFERDPELPSNVLPFRRRQR